MRALLVQLDDTSVATLIALLEPTTDLVTTDKAEEAIKIFTQQLNLNTPFDLVCLDLYEPQLEGIQTLRIMRAVEAGFGKLGLSGTTILIFSADNNPHTIMTAFHYQCEGYLLKPIDTKKLSEHIVEVRNKIDGKKK